MRIGTITVDGRVIGYIDATLGQPTDIAPDDLGGEPMGRALGRDLEGYAGDRLAGPHRGAGHQRDEAPRRHTAHHEPAQPQRERFGGEGDTDPPVQQRHDTPVNIESGDRVYGEFAAGRERARAELEAKPWLKNKVLRIMANEQGSHREGTQGVAETLFNRAANRGTSIEREARWHESEGGYYQQGSMGRGALENPRNRAVLEDSLSKVLAGSNITGNATDNSSGSLAAREIASGKFKHHRTINGESFFSPGHAEPALRDRWQRMNWAAQTMKHAEAAKAKQAAEKPAEQLARGEVAP